MMYSHNMPDVSSYEDFAMLLNGHSKAVRNSSSQNMLRKRRYQQWQAKHNSISY